MTHARTHASTIVLGALTLAACTRMPFSSGRAPAPTPAPVVAPAPKPLTPPPTPPPATFVQTTSDIRATRVIDIREGMTKAVLFRTATDFLAQKYSIDVSDQRAGFLMTPWQAGSTPQGAPDLRYRTRVVVRFLGEDWKQASVRAEANWQKSDEWDIGFDSKLLDDVTSELKARIGKQR